MTVVGTTGGPIVGLAILTGSVFATALCDDVSSTGEASASRGRGAADTNVFTASLCGDARCCGAINHAASSGDIFRVLYSGRELGTSKIG